MLKDLNPKIVQLLPSFDELKCRFYERGACLTDDEFENVYEEQSLYSGYDLKIDNTDLTAEKVAEMIAPLL